MIISIHAKIIYVNTFTKKKMLAREKALSLDTKKEKIIINFKITRGTYDKKTYKKTSRQDRQKR